MKRVFLDSSVLFSAIYSSRGHSRDLLLMALRKELGLVTSPLVLEKTRRNLSEHAPRQLIFLDFVLGNLGFEEVRPTKREVLAATKVVVLKDAPIIAAAKRASVDLLVSLDKRHILSNPELAKYTNAEVLTPQAAVKMITAEKGRK